MSAIPQSVNFSVVPVARAFNPVLVPPLGRIQDIHDAAIADTDAILGDSGSVVLPRVNADPELVGASLKAGVSKEPARDDALIVAPKVSQARTAIAVSSIAEIGPYKGVVKGLVNPALQRMVAVLDLGCSDLAIVCTDEFFGSSNYFTLLAQLKGPKFLCCLASEFRASEDLIKQLWSLPEKKAALKLIPTISEENKNLVIYDEIVERAVNFSVSDIHFEITDREFSKIKLRIFGRLKEWRSFPSDLLRGALAAAFSKRSKSGTNSGGVLVYDRATNTITEQVVNGKAYNGRLSGYPLVNGYDVVMRLLESDATSTIPTIESLGYSHYHVNEQILPAIHRNSGMMAIAGSTGSGKSTALRSFIYSLPDRSGLKIYGVEDPVEYLNPFMRQISVQRNSDDPDDVVKMKFMSALRSVLRMDPDVLMLGEVRDKDSASLASEFNRTGHRVFTTVHGDGCVDVLARLVGEEIGIHPSTLAAKKYLSAVMYQKLLPKLCEHCKLPALMHLPQRTIDTLRDKFGVEPGTMFVANSEGCAHCRVEALGIAGTKGLTAVAEILVPNTEILDAIRQKNWVLVEQLWRSQRTEGFDSPHMAGKTAFEHALYKACAGICDVQDIEADFESFETYTPYPITAKQGMSI